MLGSALSNRLFGNIRKIRPDFSKMKRNASMLLKNINPSRNSSSSPPITPNLRPSSQDSHQIDIDPLSSHLIGIEPTIEEDCRTPRMYFGGKILYIEKCRVFNDDQDNDLEWMRKQSITAPTLTHATSKNNIPLSFLPKIRGKYAYVPRWADKEEFQNIFVSTSMISHHWPLEILKELALTPVGEDMKVFVKKKKEKNSVN